jgi:ATP-binding cassette subfamily C protein CydCD
MAGRVVVCVTHDDDLARPGDAVVTLGDAARVAARPAA